METPSEWSKRFNSQKKEEPVALPDPGPETVESLASEATFPSEPFQCPACGQLLAPACRICVACRKPIDFQEVARPRAVAMPARPAPSIEPQPEPVRFPWRIFFVVLGCAFLVGMAFITLIAHGVLKQDQAQLAMNGVPALVGIWVFFDASRRRIPRPLRWGLGTILLLAVVFPWYLARRSKPEAPVPFVEAEVRPVTRMVLIALLLLFLVSLIMNIVQGPKNTSAPTPAPKIQKLPGSSQARINQSRRWAKDGWQTMPGDGA